MEIGGLKIQQNYSVAGNIQYDFIHRYLVVNYNALTFKGTCIGINNTSPTAKLHILNTSTVLNPDVGITGIYVYNPTNSEGQNSVITNRIGGSSAGRVMYSLDVNMAYGFAIKMEASSHALRFNNNWEGSGTDVMTLNVNGNINVSQLLASSYLLANGYVISRNGYDVVLFTDSAGIRMSFGDSGTGNNTFFELNASGGVTNINSNSSRPIYVRTNNQVWTFATTGYCFNPVNNGL